MSAARLLQAFKRLLIAPKREITLTKAVQDIATPYVIETRIDGSRFLQYFECLLQASGLPQSRPEVA
jgi:hypothetical protein